MALGNAVCHICGWTSGTTEACFSQCPSCKHYSLTWTYLPDNSTVSSSPSYSSSSSSSSSSGASSEDTKGAVLIVVVVAAAIAIASLAFFPGLLVTMLFGTGTLWSWIWGVLISLVVFVCCGGDWKKYLVVDACVIVICALLCWMIDSFEPFSYVFKVIGPFGK